jgi:hypothetical protein
MGLSIHYSGKIKSETLIEKLTLETEDICQSLNWKYQVIKKPNEDQLYGICFSPDGCEPVFLTFLPGGRLCTPLNLMNRDIYDRNDVDKELMYTTSTKTQFAGPDTHIAVIKLLRYLKEKYFKEFELVDEGNFWETDDEKILLEQFARYEFALNIVIDALSHMKTMTGEPVESLAERIEKVLKKRLGIKDDH